MVWTEHKGENEKSPANSEGGNYRVKRSTRSREEGRLFGRNQGDIGKKR